ncbi:MAG: ATP-grasp domain-containing protein [Brasilonema sp.]
MEKILLVTSRSDIVNKVSEYIASGKLPEKEYSFFVEYFTEEIAENLPKYVFPIKDFAEHGDLEIKIKEIVSNNKYDQVLSIDEFAVYVAAQIREALDIEGLKCEQARAFRDKMKMKHCLVNSNIRIPQTFSLEQIQSFDYPLPLVAKPRSLAGGVGVKILKTREEVESYVETIKLEESYKDMSEEQVFFEEYFDWDLFYLDCIVKNKEPIFFSVSKYLGTPLNYLKGEPLASYTYMPDQVNTTWKSFLEEIHANFKSPDGVYHIEAFHKESERPVFLEMGYRPGGGPIIDTVKGMFGIDLLLSHLCLQLKEPVFPPKVKPLNFGGWAMFPKNHQTKESLYVKEVRLPEKTYESTPLKVYTPKLGERASGEFFCHEDCLGTFIFLGEEFSVKKDLDFVLNHYQVQISKRGEEDEIRY